MSVSLSVMPRTNKTVANIPIETPGSPFSTLTSVVRLIIARRAIVVVDILLRFRASARSDPSFFRARLTRRGNDLDDRDRIMFNISYTPRYNVHNTVHYDKSRQLLGSFVLSLLGKHHLRLRVTSSRWLKTVHTRLPRYEQSSWASKEGFNRTRLCERRKRISALL